MQKQLEIRQSRPPRAECLYSAIPEKASFFDQYMYCAIHSLPGFPLFLQSGGIALFVIDFWYFSSRKSTRKINFTTEGEDSIKKEIFLINQFPFGLMQKEQKIKPARMPRPLCHLAENTIRIKLTIDDF